MKPSSFVIQYVFYSLNLNEKNVPSVEYDINFDIYVFSEEGNSKHRHSSSHHRSREPSSGSHGDEEPSSSKTRDASVETVDRGVGPTPAPPHTHVDFRAYPHPYYGLPTSFLDPGSRLESTSPYSVSNPYGKSSVTITPGWVT